MEMEKPVFPQQITEAAKRFEANNRGGSPTSAPPEIGSSDWLDALRRISKLAMEWQSNRLGGIEIQRARWMKLGQIAHEAVVRHHDSASNIGLDE